MGGVAVEVGLGHVVPEGGSGSACRIAYCMSRMAMPATSPVVQKVRRRPWGLIWWLMPAARATRVRARLAPARSIRPPGAGAQDRPGGASVDGFTDGAQDRDRQRDVCRLGPFSDDVEQLVAGLVADVGDVSAASLGDA